MKKLLILLMVVGLLFAIEQPIVKSVKYDTPAGTVGIVKLKFAEAIPDGRYIIVGDTFKADSSLVMTDAFWIDNRAPFRLRAGELDSLLVWHP